MSHYDDKAKRTLAIYVSIFILMVMGIVGGGYISYRSFEQDLRLQAEKQLSTIAELKVDELVDWRKERMSDSGFLLHNPAFSVLVERYFKNPADVEARDQIFAWLGNYRTYDQYDRIYLFDADGVEKLSIPSLLDAFDSHLAQDSIASLSLGKVTFLDFHRDTSAGGKVHLAVLVPIFAEQSDHRPLGVLVLSIAPQTYLYPYIQSSPLYNVSTETLLVRRDGEDVLLLNDLKFQKDAAVNLRIPLEKKDSPAVKAVLGGTGVVQGVDYRNMPVIAAIRAVPDSPWFLISKFDTAEVNAPLAERLQQILSMIVMAISLVGAGLVVIWRQQRISSYRIQVEAANVLRESNERFQVMFERHDAIMLLIEPQTGYILDANHSAERFYGYPKAKLCSMSIADINTLSPEQVAAERLKALKEERNYFVFSHRLASGEERSVEVHSSPISLHGKQLLFSIIYDITERKRIEDALIDSEMRARTNNTLLSLIMESPQGMVIFSLDPNFCYTAFTISHKNTMKSIWGVEIEIGMNMLDAISSPFDREKARGNFERAMRGERLILVEEYGDPASHRTFYENRYSPISDAVGDIVGLTVFVTDITERKQMEESLRKSEEKYRTVADFTYDWETWRGPDGEYLYISPSCERITGHTAAEFFIDPDLVLKITHPDDQSKVSEHFYTAIDHSMAQDLHLNFRIITPGGNLCWIEHSCTAVYGEGGKWLGRRESNRDITERKRAEAALLESEARYRRLAEHAPDIIFRYDLQSSMRLTYISPTVQLITGYTPEECYADPLLMLNNHWC